MEKQRKWVAWFSFVRIALKLLKEELLAYHAELAKLKLAERKANFSIEDEEGGQGKLGEV